MSDPVLRLAGDRVTDIIQLISRIVADVPVADRLPDRWEVARDGPRIVVEGDGTSQSTPTFTDQLIRVRVHAKSRPLAFELMDRLDSLILAHSTTGVGFRISPGHKLLVTRDGQVGGYVAGAGYTLRAPRRKVPLT